MRMLSFIRSNVKCLPVRVILPFIHKRFVQETSNYYSKKFVLKYNAGDTLNINVLFKKLEKNASMGRMFLEDIELVLARIRETRSVSLDHSMMLLRYCGTLIIEKPATRIKLVQKIWTTLEELGIPLNINHYNRLLMVYVESEFDISLTDFLNTLNKKNIEPNRVTFELIIQKYCQLGEIAAALDTLRIMREKHVPLSPKVYHALIVGYSTIKDMKNAEAVLDILDQAGIKPSSETYCHLICGHIKQGNLQKLDELLLYCDQQGITLTDTDYFNIIHSLAINNLDYEINKIIPRIKISGLYFWKAANFTLQLTTIGKPEVALKICNTMNMLKDVFVKNFRFEEFFLIHLIRCDASPDLIIKYCLDLTDKNINPYALILAMEYSLRYGKTDTALMLFKKAKCKNLPIRIHYFWPLLVNEGKKNAVDVFRILSAMQKDFDLTANSLTICHYVIPYFLKQNVDIESHLTAFKSCGISIGTVISSTVYQLLSGNEIRKAAEMAEKFHANYPSHLFQQQLITSFLNTGDVRSFTKLLKEISAGLIQKSNEIELNETKDNVSCQKFVSDVLKETIAHLVKKEDSKELLENLFLHLLEDHVGITKKSAEEIQNILRDNNIENLKSMVQQLVTEEYSPTISKPKSSTIPITSLDLKTLESLHESMESDGECTHEIKKYLLPLYARNKEFHKLFKLVEELEGNNVILSEGMYAYLIDAYVENNMLDKALGIYRTKCNASNFHLDTVKLLKFALLLVQNGYCNETFALMNKTVHSNCNVKTDVNEPLLLCKKILDFFADKGDVYHIQHFFDLIVSRKLVPLSNKLLGPLIKVHLQREDVELAIKEFGRISRKYNATPLKHVLLMKCIEQENWDNLEKIKNISSAIHGDACTLYDLLIAFVESENIEEAKKILRSFVMHSSSENQDRLIRACDKHLNNGNVKFLQTLLELTREFSIINREELYFKILCFYNRSGDADKAMELWTQLQEEGFIPSNEFLILLADILNRKGKLVPFNVPQRCEIKNKNLYRTDHQSVKVSLKTLITAGNIDEAVKLSKTFKPGVMNVKDWSQLIGACLYNGRYLDAKNLFMEFSFLMREMENYGLISHLLNEAVEARDVDFLNYCKLFFSDFWKRKTSFYNHLARFYLKTRGVNDYLKQLENACDSAKTDSEFRRFLSTFPQSGLIDILIAEPEHYQTIERLICKCTKKGDEAGIGQTVLWTYFMIEKKYNEADAIWKMHFQDKDNIVIFKKLLARINKNSDLELCVKLMSILESKKNISAPTLGILYGIMINLYIQKNAIEDALRILERALKKITIDNIIISSLYTLKAVCKVKNVSFSYNIPYQRHETISKEDD